MVSRASGYAYQICRSFLLQISRSFLLIISMHWLQCLSPLICRADSTPEESLRLRFGIWPSFSALCLDLAELPALCLDLVRLQFSSQLCTRRTNKTHPLSADLSSVHCPLHQVADMDFSTRSLLQPIVTSDSASLDCRFLLLPSPTSDLRLHTRSTTCSCFFWSARSTLHHLWSARPTESRLLCRSAAAEICTADFA